MVKNWLIRTKNNHILGPVSKEKIRELISNGSIKGDDEICSGNGYWIHIREQDLVAKYILAEEAQPFNPVQEAEPVFALSPDKDDLDYPESEDLLPKSSDLEYPEPMNSQTDSTQIGVSMADYQQDLSSGDMDLTPDSQVQKKKKMNKKKTLAHEVPIPTMKKREFSPSVRKAIKRNPVFEGKNLIFLLVLFFAIAVYLFINRSTVIKEVINYTSKLTLVSSAQAQTISSSSKKKTGKKTFR